MNPNTTMSLRLTKLLKTGLCMMIISIPILVNYLMWANNPIFWVICVIAGIFLIGLVISILEIAGQFELF